jgi:hypothetical protein
MVTYSFVSQFVYHLASLRASGLSYIDGNYLCDKFALKPTLELIGVLSLLQL